MDSQAHLPTSCHWEKVVPRFRLPQLSLFLSAATGEVREKCPGAQVPELLFKRCITDRIGMKWVVRESCEEGEILGTW